MSVKTVLETLGKIFTIWKKAAQADSLVSYTQATRVEPICIIDERALVQPALPDLLQAVNSIFAAYYLQAVAISVNVGKIDVGQLLSHLNPNRDAPDAVGIAGNFSSSREGGAIEPHNPALGVLIGSAIKPAEDYRFGLPSATRQLTLESAPFVHDHALKGDAAHVHDPKAEKESEDKLAAAKAAAKAVPKPPREYSSSAGHIDTGLGNDIKDATALSVGRMYTIDISEGNHSASIPILIRLLTVQCKSDLLVHILSDGAKAKSSTRKERWFGYKMGDLKFWRDIVATTDLIDEHKKALLQDDTGVYSEILRRRRTATVHDFPAIITGEKFSVGTASNLVITTRETIKELEAVVGGKFDNFDVRQMVFRRSYLMIVAVVDTDYDQVTFYYRGIKTPTEMSVRDLKKPAKEGSNLVDVLRAFQQGTAPRF